MPVREAIHSSLVSTSFSRSALDRTASGTLLPQPASLQPAGEKLYEFHIRIGQHKLWGAAATARQPAACFKDAV